MASRFSSNAPLPQGFSVYQPQLGAQLQFFPALGTQELDDMMNAYIPGSAPLKEKRASISLDFLEHTQLTGQTFKFYPVYYASSPVAPVAASPVNSIATSSFSNTSPVNSTWDWSQASASPSTSSRSSMAKSRKASKSGSMASRYSTADLSHLPGMKIMTKDGQDVTDSASRGSKTKEQRDHAHLMRIIKACDACRRKKIRCDPSHKKRAAASQSQPQSAAAKSAKKARTTVAAAAVAAASTTPPQKPMAGSVAISSIGDNPPISMSLFGLDPTFTFTGLDSFESTDQISDSWEEFVQYPPADVDENYDFFLDPEGYFSSQSSASSSSASPAKALTPASQQELLAVSGLDEREGMSLSESTSPQLPFLQENHTGSANSYTDFNLFSPSSSFSEDDRMVPISSTRTLSPSQPSVSESDMFVHNSFDPDGHTLATDWSGMSESASPLENRLVAGADISTSWYSPGASSGESGDQDARAGISLISPRPSGWVDGVRIVYPPGGSVLVTAPPGSDVEMIATNVPSQASAPASGSISIAILESGKSAEVATGPSNSTALQFGGEIQEDLLHGPSPTERGRIRSEPSVDHSSQSELLLGQAFFRTESTSQRYNSPSSMAAAAHHSVDFSTGSVESPSMVLTEHLDNTNATSQASLLLSAYGATSGILAGSAAFAAAGEDTMAVASPQASSAALVQSDMSTADALGSLGGSSPGSSSAQQLYGEVNVNQQTMAPEDDEGLQPSSLLLLQATSPQEHTRAADKSADLGVSLESSRLFGSAAQALAQASAMVLIGTLASAMLASMLGSAVVFSLASLLPAVGAIFQGLMVRQSSQEWLETTPSTMSSPRSSDKADSLDGKPGFCRRAGVPPVRKPELSVLRHTMSRISSHFSSSALLHGGMASALVAPVMG